MINSQQSAQTVIEIHEHLKRLKDDSHKLKKKLSAAHRGYFTPKEEEEVKHIFVAYWNARSALFEVIYEMQDESERTEGDLERKDKFFLVSLAAASVLVSAAQFLYETFDDYPVVRDKLNEEDVALGIPRYSYSSILESLYNSEHLIELYYGRRYYETHFKDFKQYAENNPHLQELMDIVKDLKIEIRTNFFHYLKNTIYLGFRKILENIENSAVHQGVYPVQKFVSRILGSMSVYPIHKPQVPKKVKKKILSKLKPGDVLLTRKEYEVTNYFLPGYWPHAGLFLGKMDKENKFLEALKDGVKIRTHENIFAADSLIVLRPNLNKEEVEEAISRGLKHEGKPYDFDFDFKESHRLVCTEVIYRSFDGVGNIDFKLASRAGRKNLSTEDIIEVALKEQGFDCILVYCPEKSKRILYKEKARVFTEKLTSSFTNEVS